MRFSGSEVLRRCRVIPTVAAMAGALVFGAACSDDGGGGGGGGGGNQTTFLGVISSDDGLQSGEITISVATSSPGVEGPTTVMAFANVNATGTHKLTGTAEALTGTYDDVTKILALTGGGYTLGGGYDPSSGRLEGFFTGPGNGGVFVTTESGSGDTAYCGTFTGSDDGTFSFVVSGTDLLGTAYSTSGGTPIPLDGTVSGSSITISNPLGGSPLATGTISGTSASGTWNDGQGNSGTWTGSVCQ